MQASEFCSTRNRMHALEDLPFDQFLPGCDANAILTAIGVVAAGAGLRPTGAGGAYDYHLIRTISFLAVVRDAGGGYHNPQDTIHGIEHRLESGAVERQWVQGSDLELTQDERGRVICMLCVEGHLFIVCHMFGNASLRDDGFNGAARRELCFHYGLKYCYLRNPTEQGAVQVLGAERLLREGCFGPDLGYAYDLRYAELQAAVDDGAWDGDGQKRKRRPEPPPRFIPLTDCPVTRWFALGHWRDVLEEDVF